MKKDLKTRNPYALVCRRVAPRVVPAKKGKGSVYKRVKKVKCDD